MLIGGVENFTVIDYPGNLAAIVFTVGCNFRCPYCYNPDFVIPEEVKKFNEEYKKGNKDITKEEDFFKFLDTRVGKLDGVVVTGGEPTLQVDLEEFIIKIKDKGFKVKLDSNGTNPEVLQKLIDKNLIDYVAMDIKGAPKKYNKASGVEANLKNLEKSVIIIKNSGLPYEFRSTIVPSIISKEDIKEMGEFIEGADKWFLQPFKNDTKMVNSDFEGGEKYLSTDLEEMRLIGEKYVKECLIR